MKNHHLKGVTAIDVDYQRIKEAIQRIMGANYPNFIQALISIETGVDDRDYLKESYCNYVKKYLKMSDEEEELIGNFIRKLEIGKVDFFDPYLNYENTKSLANALQDEENIDVIKLYIFLTSDLQLTGIDVEDARDYHEELVEAGYKQIGDFISFMMTMVRVSLKLG